MRSLALAAVFAAWVGALSLGGYATWHAKAAPSRSADAPARWPADSGLERTPGLATLVQINHPRCVCTRASLDELNTILDDLAAPVSTFVLFVRPDGAEPGFELTDSWTRAHDLPGTTVLADQNGAEAARFGAWASGQTLLYDADGKLVFAGGVTAFRGHIGDNVGRERVLALLNKGVADAATSAVFGCPLRNDETTTKIW